MNTITWLHISDLHFREKTSYDENIVLRALLRDVAQRIAHDGLQPDLILVSGDVAHAGKPAEYGLARRFFDDLLATANLGKDRLFLVPGNHDVDRDRVTQGAKAIADSLDAREAVNGILAEPGSRRLLMARFEGYAAFLNDYLGDHLPFDDERYFYVRELELAGLRLALLGLNSAWASASGEDRAKGLLVGEPQVRAALDRAEGADLRIALLHHPFDRLRGFDRRDVEPMLCDKCDLVLHGHMQQAGLLQARDPDAEAVIIAAGACYETRRFPNSHNYVRLDSAAGTGVVHLRRYSDERGGFWARDTLTYRNLPDGVFTFPLPARLGGKPLAARPERPAREIAPPGPDLDRLRADYLGYLRDAYQYLDFKGLPHVEKFAQQLPLDAVYVPLRARPEMPEGETWLRVAGRLWAGDGPPQDEGAPEEDVRIREAARFAGAAALRAEPIPADEALSASPALVILGDPGAGKSTLLKVLALQMARGRDGPLPILVPLNAYAAALEGGQISLHDFLATYFATRQHRLKDLGPLFDAVLEAGQAVVLLDGLDEVQTHRAFLVRLVQDFASEYLPEPGEGDEPLQGNRLVVTSRIVGYREAPLAGPRWRTYTLDDFGREEIERFADRWTLAFEIATHGDTEIAREAAAKERQDLLAAIWANPGIERLASNPLLLTILALIKRQGVTLPQRRVELYELYLRTLINAWNKARSLDRQPAGPEMDYLETVQVLAPLGLWLRETNPTAGLVSRSALETWLTDYYRQEWEMAAGLARREARDFLRAVHRYSNLLVERGRDQYGFLHLTFEEMLAAKGIAAQAQLGPEGAVETILRHLHDPNWHETILLAVGALGVVAQQPLAAGQVLGSLCNPELEAGARGRNVVTAGEALLDVGEVGVGRRAAVRVTGCLVGTMQDPAVPARTRRQAGLLLGRLGWQPGDLDAFVEIPAGHFLYGEERERRKIPYRYWIGKYPVTNLQFARFVEDGGYHQREWWSEEGWAWRTGEGEPDLSGIDDESLRKVYAEWVARRRPEKRDRPYWWDNPEWNNPIFPVVGVSWFEAGAYCRWLETRDPVPEAPQGYVVRLPAEEEWERAARGTDGREYPWGSDFDFTRLSCAEAWEEKEIEDWWKWQVPEFAGTTAVCTYPQGARPDSIWDAAGNIWEWTASRLEPGSGLRAVRGGSWHNDQRGARCAFRGWIIPVAHDRNLGLRVVVSLASSES